MTKAKQQTRTEPEQETVVIEPEQVEPERVESKREQFRERPRPQKPKEEEKKFTIMDLEKGKVVKDLDEKVREAALDIRDRPDNMRPRKVTLELIMNSKDGFVSVQAVAKLTLPPDGASKTICGMPDSEGNLRNLNPVGVNQHRLPIFYDEE